MKTVKKNKVLWLAPHLNHYKLRLLNHLANDSEIDLCVFFGSGSNNANDVNINIDLNFKKIKVNVSKKDFGTSKLVKEKLKTIFNEFDWIMIPVEKKNITLFLLALKLRQKNKNVRLFSYNHPVLKSAGGKVTFLDKLMTKFYYRNFNRVVFYTEQSCNWALKNGYLKKQKAYWANNTIDNTEIKKYYTFQLPPENPIAIVFIGRLDTRKRIPDLIKYYTELKKHIPNLVLDIIGDGPERYHVDEASKSNSSINSYGALIDESKITPIMQRASIVFIPGHSGLSVAHAFLYGRPYVTLQGPSHAPELDYLEINKNGLILDGDFESNISDMINLLNNRTQLENFCEVAKQKGEYLTVQKWVEQIKQSLN